MQGIKINCQVLLKIEAYVIVDKKDGTMSVMGGQ